MQYDHLLATEREETVGQIINLGCGREIPIRDLILKIHRETASSSELRIGELPHHPTEIWRMFADNGKARRLLGWTPQIDFKDGLSRTVEWYRAFLSEYGGKNSHLIRLSTLSENPRHTVV